jgi:hypothetical protein
LVTCGKTGKNSGGRWKTGPKLQLFRRAGIEVVIGGHDCKITAAHAVAEEIAAIKHSLRDRASVLFFGVAQGIVAAVDAG